MKAQELIGKWAIRTKPTRDMGDRSYTDTPLFILKADNSHIVCMHYEECLRSKESHILNDDFCDNNWIDYKKLISLSFWVKILKWIACRFIK